MPTLLTQLREHFAHKLRDYNLAHDEVTVEINAADWHDIALALRDREEFQFTLLIDVCGVDYLYYGFSQWQTEDTTLTGFSRAVEARAEHPAVWSKPRFAVVYHLLSIAHNRRLRVRVFPTEDPPRVDSVVDLWPAANWFEREAFDLFGIIFQGHPDLRRILTDYGFIGHPFRKDFPLIGEVEMRYDADLQRCVYEPVSIQPRTLVPKVIRHDNRYVGRGGVNDGNP